MSLACVGAALYLILHGNQEGWGWFLFVGLLCYRWYSTDEDDSSNENED